VTIDAMRCQRDIANKIIAKKADYVDVLVEEQKAMKYKDTTISTSVLGATSLIRSASAKATPLRDQPASRAPSGAPSFRCDRQ
jgi:hypothetical protein